MPSESKHEKEIDAASEMSQPAFDMEQLVDIAKSEDMEIVDQVYITEPVPPVVTQAGLPTPSPENATKPGEESSSSQPPVDSSNGKAAVVNEGKVPNDKPKTWLDAAKKVQKTKNEDTAVNVAKSASVNLSKRSASESHTATSSSQKPATVTPITSLTTSQSSAAQITVSIPRSEEHRLKHSVYVRNIHSGISYHELKAAFENYGHVIRLDAIFSRGYAFIEFDHVESVQKVLTLTTPINLRGLDLVIQERNVNTSAQHTNGQKPIAHRRFESTNPSKVNTSGNTSDIQRS
jgi:RNA recognition motif-containing protein